MKRFLTFAGIFSAMLIVPLASAAERTTTVPGTPSSRPVAKAAAQGGGGTVRVEQRVFLIDPFARPVAPPRIFYGSTYSFRQRTFPTRPFILGPPRAVPFKPGIGFYGYGRR